VPKDTNGLNWTDYGDPEWIPLGPKLSSYPLHADEWRHAFLERLVAVGSIGVIEAASHVYELLAPPKDYRCAHIAQLAGVKEAGKLALVIVLNAFIEEWLGELGSLPISDNYATLHDWNEAVHSVWASEAEREQAVVAKFATILDGRTPQLA
jgi:hypothetical protein